MFKLLENIFLTTVAIAGEGKDHTHNMSDEAMPVLIGLGVLIVVGVAFHFIMGKKK